jgi:hypothetical protein
MMMADWEAYWRDLLGKVDVLGELHLALLERALQVCLLHRLARVGILVNQGNQVVISDRKVHLGALLDILVEFALGRDAECLAPANTVLVQA